MNDFLFNDSKVYLRHLRYTTTLLETDNQIIAYYSLANDLLSISDRQDFADEMRDSKNKIDFDFWGKPVDNTSSDTASSNKSASHQSIIITEIIQKE